MYKEYLEKIITDRDLSIEDSYEIASGMLTEKFTSNQIASLLTGIKMIGEDYKIVTGFAKALKDHSVDTISTTTKLIDVCGTGGDKSNSFNISTTVGLVLAAGGMTVAKHGNSSISSLSGSADVLKELGYDFKDDPEIFKKELDSKNFTFLFAPLVHKKLKDVMVVRKDLKIPTVFNIIGPLCNPYELDYQVIGVYREDLIMVMARALQALGIKRAAVVHGHGGMDELSISGISKMAYIIDGSIITDKIDPNNFGIKYQDKSTLKGGSPKENADIMVDIFKNSKGPKLDVVALNAGLAFFIGKKVDTLKEGVTLAYKLIADNTVYNYYNKFRGE